MRFITICLLALLAFVAIVRADGSDDDLYEEDDTPRIIGSYSCQSTEFELELEEEDGSRKRQTDTEEGTYDEEEDGEDEDEEEFELHFRIKFGDTNSAIYEAESEGTVSGVETESKVRVKFTGAGVYEIGSTGLASLVTDCPIDDWTIDCPATEPSGDFSFDVTSIPAGYTLSNSFVTATNAAGQLPSQAEVLVSTEFASLCPGATLAANQYYCVSVEIVSASEQDEEEGTDESAVVAGQTLFKWADQDADGSWLVKYTVDGEQGVVTESDDDDFKSSSRVIFCPQTADGVAVDRISSWDPTIQVDRSGAATLVASLLALFL